MDAAPSRQAVHVHARCCRRQNILQDQECQRQAIHPETKQPCDHVGRPATTVENILFQASPSAALGRPHQMHLFPTGGPLCRSQHLAPVPGQTRCHLPPEIKSQQCRTGSRQAWNTLWQVTSSTCGRQLRVVKIECIMQAAAHRCLPAIVHAYMHYACVRAHPLQ